MLAFVAVVKRSQNTKKASIVLAVCMKERCQVIDDLINTHNLTFLSTRAPRA